MNYGEFFLELYNNEFIKLKKDFIKYLKSNFEADETFPVIFDTYLSKLYRLQESQYSKDKLLMDCWEVFRFRYNTYNKNAVKNIIEKNILAKFKKNLSRNTSSILEYQEFIKVLAKLSITKDFESRIRDDFNKIKTAFNDKDISKILKVKKNEKAEYLVHYVHPKMESKNISRVENIEKEKNKIESNIPQNPFNDEQKFILLNLLFSCIKDENYDVSEIEILSVLKICSSSLVYLPLGKIYKTEYKKFCHGIDYSKKNNRYKKNNLIIIREECLKLELNEISKYIKSKIRKL